MASNGNKPAVQSMGIWGALLAGLPLVNALLGLDIGSEDVNQVVAAVGVIMAFIGRLRASSVIDRIF